MEFLKSIFEVFSRRRTSVEDSPTPVSEGLRNRVLLLCRDVIGKTGYLAQFWEQIHQKLEYLHGTPVLSPEIRTSSQADDVINFLVGCESDHFLDFVEYIFQVDAYWRVNAKSEFVDQINTFFAIDKLPYFLTDYVEVEEPSSFRGSPTIYIKVGSYPRVISKEHDLIHSETIQPTLNLLNHPTYSSANAEFLDALEDYRKQDFGDCLTKCGSAFESVMKVLCDKNGWAYKQTDTASTLVDKVVSNTVLDSFFAQPLMLVATIRNRLSKSHGAGTVSRVVPPHVAQFTINATAAGILLVIAEARR